MAYTSIYRKYRPDAFDKVIGQEHIVRTLKNQIKNDSIGHAYIFTGTRGTGKTSVAKIFARAVNCKNPAEGSPCGKCENCAELSKNDNFDILEIDAASNNSVDQIRELTDKINFPPTIGKYKVYIVDEVHMLSRNAFNALLKTLEEPPSHAIFILATTEIHQIPQTILSRCLRFDFRLVSTSEIAERIRFIFDELKVRYEPQAVELIASSGGGSVRDAMSVADMCVSFSDGDVTYDSVLEVLGASDPKKLIELAKFIADGNGGESLKAVASLSDKGKSIPVLAADIASLFRNALYIKNCGSAKELLSLPDEIYNAVKTIAEAYSVEKMLNLMKIFSGLEGEFRYSSQHRIIFEAAVMIACSDAPTADKVKELERKIAVLEKRVVLISRQGTATPSVAKDARQIWKEVATALENGERGFLALSALEADPEIKGDDFVVTFADTATLSFFTDLNNRNYVLNIFGKLSDKRLVFEAAKKLDEDKALPYLKQMFGAGLEIK